MKIIDTNTDNDLEMRICYGLANNEEFMLEFADKIKKRTFDNRFVDLTAQLCIGYFKKFNKVPANNLTNIITRASSLHKLEADSASEMLIIASSFSSQPPIVDIKFEIDSAYTFLQSKMLVLATEEAKALAESGKTEEAHNLLTSFEQIAQVKVEGKDVFDYTLEEYDDIFNKTSEQLIKLPYALGSVMNDTLVRNGFGTFMGRPKVGKTWWLMLLARAARNQGNKTIFISAGDMTREQTVKRILQGDAKTSASEYYLDKQLMPCMDCMKNQRGTCFKRKGDGNLLNEWNELDTMPIIKDDSYIPCCDKNCADYVDKKLHTIAYQPVKHPLLNAEMAVKLQEKWKQSNNKGALVIEHAPSGTLTVDKRRSLIRAICKKYGWEHPDVIIVDYANILAYEKSDERASIHHIWQSLRADADIFNCLVWTATHSNSTAFDFEDLSLRSFALDRRIFDEVSACFAINQTLDERKIGVSRIAALLKRENEFDESKQAMCYGCLAMGSPHFVSKIEYREPPKPKNFSK